MAAPHVYVEPGMSISTPEGESVDFSLEADVRWTEYLGEQPQIKAQSGLSAGGRLGLKFNPKGDVSLALSNDFRRSNEPPTSGGDRTINHTQDSAMAMLQIKPGAGLLRADLGYRWSGSFYKPDKYDELNKQTHHLLFKGTWKFLPKTALVFNANKSYVRYAIAQRGEGVTVVRGKGLRNIDSSPERLLGGIEGLFFPNVSINLLGGYGWSNYDEGGNFEGPLARAELEYSFGPSSFENKFVLGYERYFSDSSIGNYVRGDRGYGTYQQEFFDRRLQLRLRGSVDDVETRGFPTSDRADVRRGPDAPLVRLPEALYDTVLKGRIGAQYHIARWWSFKVSYQYERNMTDSDVLVQQGAEQVARRRYQQHITRLSTVLRY